MFKHFVLSVLLILSLSFGVPQSCEAASYRDVIFEEISGEIGSGEVAVWLTDMILYWCSVYQVDPLLVTALMEAESSFDHSCVSSAGAVGFMQLMPDEAETLGVNIYDPAENIIGGVSHIRDLLNTFTQYGYYGVTFAVAAYNAGSGHVYSFMNGERDKFYDETDHYVRKISRIHDKMRTRLAM